MAVLSNQNKSIDSFFTDWSYVPGRVFQSGREYGKQATPSVKGEYKILHGFKGNIKGIIPRNFPETLDG